MQWTAVAGVGHRVEEHQGGQEGEQEFWSQVGQAGRPDRSPLPVAAEDGGRAGDGAPQLGWHVEQGPHRRHLPGYREEC